MEFDDYQDKKGPPPSLVRRIIDFACNAVEKPVIWFRETVVEPNRPEYYWYHESMRRVPTIDECYDDDMVCQFEADHQFYRDRKVDVNILEILRKRNKLCRLENKENLSRCDEIRDYYYNATTNFFIKYGDMSYAAKAIDCYMKQKHRMAWERRHGPVGSGRKSEQERTPRKSEGFH